MAQHDQIVGVARKAWAAYWLIHPPDTSATSIPATAARRTPGGKGN
jgi:hypothetical protein